MPVIVGQKHVKQKNNRSQVLTRSLEHSLCRLVAGDVKGLGTFGILDDFGGVVVVTIDIFCVDKVNRILRSGKLGGEKVDSDYVVLLVEKLARIADLVGLGSSTGPLLLAIIGLFASSALRLCLRCLHHPAVQVSAGPDVRFSHPAGHARFCLFCGNSCRKTNIRTRQIVSNVNRFRSRNCSRRRSCVLKHSLERGLCEQKCCIHLVAWLDSLTCRQDSFHRLRRGPQSTRCSFARKDVVSNSRTTTES